MSDESIAPGPTDRREFEAGLSDLIEAAREHDVSVRGAYTVPSRDTDSRDIEAHITEIADDRDDEESADFPRVPRAWLPLGSVAVPV